MTKLLQKPSTPLLVPVESARTRALAAARELNRRRLADPLAVMRWTPPQAALLRSEAPRVLLRTGNQWAGKTTCGLAEVVYACLGKHPFKEVPEPPQEWWVLTASWSQSVAIQTKLWDLLPKDEISPLCEYDPVRGFRGRHPSVVFKNGSMIRIKTSRQGGLSLAGSTLSGVLIDEPPSSARVYAEIERRLTRTGGRLVMSLTPVNADVRWLQELCEQKDSPIADLHFDMHPSNMIPEGSLAPLRTEDGTPMDQAWCDEQRKAVLAWEAPVVLDGEWSFVQTGRVFAQYNPDLHRIPNLLQSAVRPKGAVKLCLGIDYGEDALRTAGVYVYIDDSIPSQPKVWVVGEYAPQGATTEDMDARGILSMLAARGDSWSSLDHAHGDKRYSGRSTSKSNKSFLLAVQRELKLTGPPRPSVHGAKKGQGGGAGSLWASVRLLHDAMVRPGHFYIDASLTRLHDCLLKWQGSEKEEFKDQLDALRYALRPYWYGGRGQASSTGGVLRRRF